jgi:hypothetical protein
MIISGTSKSMSVLIRGKLGFSSAAGFARCGYSRCGASKDYGGIYRKRKTLAVNQVSRVRYYRPTDPQSEAQLARRAVFASGIAAFQALTPEQKMLLSEQARRSRMTTLNIFMREWLKSN